MSIITAVLCYIVAVLLKRKYRSWVNPGSLFAVLWGTVMLLYSFRLFSIYSASDKTIIIYSVGVFSFLVGCVPVRFSLGQSRNKIAVCHNEGVGNLYVGKKTEIILLLLSVISLVIMIVRAWNTIPYWTGGAGAVKQANAEGYIHYSMLVSILYTFMAGPIETLTIFHVVISIFFNKTKFTWIQTILTFLILIFGYISSGSKFSLFIPVFSIVIAYSVRKSFYKKSKTIAHNKTPIWKWILIIFMATVAISYILILLNNKYGGWSESLYMYLVGCIPCGDNAIQDMVGGPYFYGMVSFNGLYRTMAKMFLLFGIEFPYIDVMNDAYSSMLVYEKAINISPTVRYNAFISMFSYFYKDMGFRGVIVFSLIFGVAASLFYKKMIREKSIKTIVAYLFICYLILFSIVRFQFYLAPTAMIFIYIIIIYGRQKKAKSK